MKDKITISYEDFMKTAYLLEKIHYITHRANTREDENNRAYALAITFAKEKVEEQLNEQRMKLYSYFSEQDEEVFENLCEDIDYNIPYDKTLEELQAELKPYLVEFKPLREQ